MKRLVAGGSGFAFVISLGVVAPGCARPRDRVAVPRELFPPVASSAEARPPSAGPCPATFAGFLDVEGAAFEGAPSVPGADAGDVWLDVDARTRVVEPLAIRIEEIVPEAGTSFAASAGGHGWKEISFTTSEVARFRVRVLVRPRVEGGLFDSIADCYERSTNFLVDERHRGFTVVIEDGSDASSPRTWSIVRVEER